MTTNLPISSTAIPTEEEKQVLALFQEGKRKVSKTLLVESPSQLIIKNIEEYLILKQVREEKEQEKILSMNQMLSKFRSKSKGKLKN